MKKAVSTPTRVWIMGHTGRVGKLLVENFQTDPTLSQAFTLQGGHSSKEILDCLGGKRNGALAFSDSELKGRLVDVDLIIDFSSPKSSTDFLETLQSIPKFRQNQSLEGLHYLCATTGFESLDFFVKSLEALCETKKLTALYAPNTSLGILTLRHILRDYSRKLSELGFDIELVETHHRRKKDAPSGTALSLAKSIQSALPSIQVKSDLLTRKNQLRGENEVNISSIRGGGVFGEHDVRFISDFEELKLTHRAFTRNVFAEGSVRLGSWLVQDAPKKAKCYTLDDIKL